MPKAKKRREPNFPKIGHAAPVKQWLSMASAALVGGVLSAIFAYEYIKYRADDTAQVETTTKETRPTETSP